MFGLGKSRKKKNERIEPKKEDVIELSIMGCSCGSNAPIKAFKLGNIVAGGVIQITCACGIGVHHRTGKQAQDLWNTVQRDLHRKKADTQEGATNAASE